MAFVLCLSLWACGEEPPREHGEGYRFTDDIGETVFLPSSPRRVAVLFSSFADMWRLAGGEIAVTVGESIERGFASADTLIVDAGAGKSISCEALLAASVDFVIASADIAAQLEAADLLRKANIPVACFRVESFTDYAEVMGIFTDITGDRAAYGTHVTAVRTAIDDILASVGTETPHILFVRCGAGYSATKAKGTKDHFAAAMLAELGCDNIADKVPVLLDGLSIESIISENPDYIFFSTMGDEARAKDYMESVLSDPLWQSLDAVREGRYTYLPKELFHYKPNARWDEAYAYLKECLYEDKNES